LAIEGALQELERASKNFNAHWFGEKQWFAKAQFVFAGE
jgi:hypothetical protein